VIRKTLVLLLVLVMLGSVITPAMAANPANKDGVQLVEDYSTKHKNS